MRLTLRNILKTETFRDFKVLAGEGGLDRIVTSVSVMDAPDISNWLKGGEILMTTGYVLKDDTMQFINLIRSIEKANAAALFIKINRFINALPREVYETAESINFPLVFMPIQLAFTDVINPVLALLVNEQAKKLEISDRIHRSFTKLVLNGGNEMQIISTLSKIVGGDVAYLAAGGGEKYVSAVSEDFRKEMEEAGPETEFPQYKKYPVRIEKKNYGYVIFAKRGCEEEIDEYNDVAFEHAITVLELEIQKKISNLEIENRHKNEFVQDIILNNIKYPDEIKVKADLYNWSYQRGLTVVIVAIDGYKEKSRQSAGNTEIQALENTRQGIFSISQRVIQRDFKSAIFTSLSDRVIYLIELPENRTVNQFYGQISETAELIRDLIAGGNTGFTATIGVGDYVEKIMDAHVSYKNAQNAVKLNRQLYKSNRTGFYKDLGIYRLLDVICKTGEAKIFCKNSIGLLTEYDRKYGSELLKTLLCIKECNWNLKCAAEKMYVHYNTVKYRYKKIEEIVGLNLEDSEARFIISMSIKITRMANEESCT